MNKVVLSPLPHSWLIDIDGTILKHNGYLNGRDELLEGVLEFWSKLPKEDRIILVTSRSKSAANLTLGYLDQLGLRYDDALFGIPVGERILINDIKPKGLKTALAINIQRNQGLNDIDIAIDPAI